MAMTLAQLATLFNTPPAKSYNDLNTQQRQDFRDALAPLSGFNAPQRNWFKDWWFVCTAADVTAMNALLPSKTRVQAISHLGTLYLNIDLATDALDAGSTYFAIRNNLRPLIITNVTPGS